MWPKSLNGIDNLCMFATLIALPLVLGEKAGHAIECMVVEKQWLAGRKEEDMFSATAAFQPLTLPCCSCVCHNPKFVRMA